MVFLFSFLVRVVLGCEEPFSSAASVCGSSQTQQWTSSLLSRSPVLVGGCEDGSVHCVEWESPTSCILSQDVEQVSIRRLDNEMTILMIISYFSFQRLQCL